MAAVQGRLDEMAADKRRPTQHKESHSRTLSGRHDVTVIVLGRPSAEKMAAVLSSAAPSPFTYDDVGATREGKAPTGFHRGSYSNFYGQGDEAFERGKTGLRDWSAHRAAGVRIHPPNAPLTAGTVVAGWVAIGPISVVFPCRLVYVIDEPRRFGWAYGTLPGHPESGEEAFMIEHHDDDRVSFTIEVFSKPADPLTRLAGPIARALQARATRRYLTGIA
jgi:uncharacterized protein (UPF0548 family)